VSEETYKDKEAVDPLAKQAEIIAAIRSHLSDEENERASDRLIWQRGVRFGPNTPEGHAESLRNALAAADSYGDELMRELGLEPPFDDEREAEESR
jgi:hypothetical protein